MESQTKYQFSFQHHATCETRYWTFHVRWVSWVKSELYLHDSINLQDWLGPLLVSTTTSSSTSQFIPILSSTSAIALVEYWSAKNGTNKRYSEQYLVDCSGGPTSWVYKVEWVNLTMTLNFDCPSKLSIRECVFRFFLHSWQRSSWGICLCL